MGADRFLFHHDLHDLSQTAYPQQAAAHGMLPSVKTSPRCKTGLKYWEEFSGPAVDKDFCRIFEIKTFVL